MKLYLPVQFNFHGKILKSTVSIISLILGIILIAINLYGLTQPIRKPGLGVTDHKQLRFIPDVVRSFEESMEAIDQLSERSNSIQRIQLVEQVNHIINQSLVHVDWKRVDPVSYRQLVPIWDNYFLFFLGKYSDLPQFNRYHFSDYKRSIRRGIGICGDASTSMSSVLDRLQVPNRIVSFKGHVIVEYTGIDGQKHLMDPDFGVSLGVNIKELVENPLRVRNIYLDAGYNEKEIDYLLKAYQTNYLIFDDTYHFMSKRYIFENLSYVAKWLFPLLLIMFSMVYLNKCRLKIN